MAETEHKRLMKHHHDRLGFISDGGAQGKAIQSLLKKFPVEDCIAYYEFQVLQLECNGGRRTTVSWLSVQKTIAEWTVAGKPARPKNPDAPRNAEVGRNTEVEVSQWKCKTCFDLKIRWGYGKTIPCPDCAVIPSQEVYAETSQVMTG